MESGGRDLQRSRFLRVESSRAQGDEMVVVGRVERVDGFGGGDGLPAEGLHMNLKGEETWKLKCLSDVDFDCLRAYSGAELRAPGAR